MISAGAYEVVLREGAPQGITGYVDVVLLVDQAAQHPHLGVDLPAPLGPGSR